MTKLVRIKEEALFLELWTGHLPDHNLHCPIMQAAVYKSLKMA
jgi:hypothetical protein